MNTVQIMVHPILFAQFLMDKTLELLCWLLCIYRFLIPSKDSEWINCINSNLTQENVVLPYLRPGLVENLENWNWNRATSNCFTTEKRALLRVRVFLVKYEFPFPRRWRDEEDTAEYISLVRTFETDDNIC